MPIKSKKLCNRFGCNKLTRETYCDEHIKDKNKSKQNTNEWHKLYNSRWRKIRIEYLKRNPLCVMCKQEGLIRPATVVDHIKDHKGDLRLFYDRNNYQALCVQCHNRKTYATHRGGIG